MFSTMSEFRDIRTLIIDPSGHSKALLRSILTNHGVFDVACVAGTDEALETLRKDPFSIVFCDELAGPLEPFAFLRALRRDLTTRDVTVPVVLVSSGAHSSKVKAARDSGMSDVIVKPVSIGTIERKLRSLLHNPKPFITAGEFVGPDRRCSAADRRHFGERLTILEDRRGTSSTGSLFDISRLKPTEPIKS